MIKNELIAGIISSAELLRFSSQQSSFVELSIVAIICGLIAIPAFKKAGK